MSFFKAFCRTLCSTNETQNSPSTELEFVDESLSKQEYSYDQSNLQQIGSFQKNNAVDSENVEIAED
tara:strand:- start:618 stop:818 length:201 start_codon:yes stop_codon:yes gene_type:complete